MNSLARLALSETLSLSPFSPPKLMHLPFSRESGVLLSRLGTMLGPNMNPVYCGSPKAFPTYHQARVQSELIRMGHACRGPGASRALISPVDLWGREPCFL